jgi:hypothetical protein
MTGRLAGVVHELLPILLTNGNQELVDGHRATERVVVSISHFVQAVEQDVRIDGYLPPEQRLHLGLLDRLGRIIIDERGESLDTCQSSCTTAVQRVSDGRTSGLR